MTLQNQGTRYCKRRTGSTSTDVNAALQAQLHRDVTKRTSRHQTAKDPQHKGKNVKLIVQKARKSTRGEEVAEGVRIPNPGSIAQRSLVKSNLRSSDTSLPSFRKQIETEWGDSFREERGHYGFRGALTGERMTTRWILLCNPDDVRGGAYLILRDLQEGCPGGFATLEFTRRLLSLKGGLVAMPGRFEQGGGKGSDFEPGPMVNCGW